MWIFQLIQAYDKRLASTKARWQEGQNSEENCLLESCDAKLCQGMLGLVCPSGSTMEDHFSLFRKQGLGFFV